MSLREHIAFVLLYIKWFTCAESPARMDWTRDVDVREWDQAFGLLFQESIRSRGRSPDSFVQADFEFAGNNFCC